MYTKYYLRLRNCAIISNMVMWLAAGTVYGQTSDLSNEVHHDSIYISLPVFISSIIATAVFTWTVAKYDSKRIGKIEELEHQMTTLTNRLTQFVETQESRGSGR